MTKHLILHFDVNKTMIMMDPVQGKDVSNVVNDIMAEKVYGVVEQDSKEWKWNGKPLNTAAEAQEVSFANYLRAKYPNVGTPQEMKEGKRLRKLYRATFTHEGNPGAALRSDFDRLVECLNTHIIVPSFFDLILSLEQEKRSYSLILRTFGQDVQLIASEFNAFCQGKHPSYPNVRLDGSIPGSIDRQIDLTHPEGCGTFHRATSDGSASLILGTLEQHEDLNMYTNMYEIIQGYDAIYTRLEQVRKTRASIALRDYYPYWWSKHEASEAGKLLLLNRSDHETHVVFFDDNILDHDAHIVDARDAFTGEIIPFEQTKGIHLLRVEPLDAIQSESYFRKLLKRIVQWN